jgi:hypothetical protein
MVSLSSQKSSQVLEDFSRPTTCRESRRSFIRVQEFGHRKKHDPTRETGMRGGYAFMITVLLIYLFFDWDWIFDHYFPDWFNSARQQSKIFIRKVIGADDW